MYDVSYANVMMYSSVIPSMDSGDKKDEKVINADDPRNAHILEKLINEQ